MATKTALLFSLIVISFILCYLRPRGDDAENHLPCLYGWINADIGQDVILPCKNNVDPNATRFWRRGATSFLDISSAGPIELKQDGKYSLLPNGSLLISGITNDEFGHYMCDIESFGTARTTILTTDAFSWKLEIAFYSCAGVILGISVVYLTFVILKVIFYKCFKYKKPFSKSEKDECCAMPNCCSSGCFSKLNKWIKKWYNSACDKLSCACSQSLKKWSVIIFQGSKAFISKVVICSFDVATDIIQAIIHFTNDHYTWGSLTAFFVFFPFFLSVFLMVKHVVRNQKNNEPLNFCQELKHCLLHLPGVQLIEHLRVFWNVVKLQYETKKQEDNFDLTDDDIVKVRNHKNFLKFNSRRMAAFESAFQRFKVIECMGESAPQTILQIGIIFKDAPNTLGSAIKILSNVSILFSVLNMVNTFTGLYLKMPYGQVPIADSSPSMPPNPPASNSRRPRRTQIVRAVDGNELEMQPLNGPQTEEGSGEVQPGSEIDGHSSNRQPSLIRRCLTFLQETGSNMKSRVLQISLCKKAESQEKRGKKQEIPNLKFPYKTFKSNFFVGPVMLVTIFPRVCNLALIFTFEKYSLWIALFVFAILFAIYWDLYHFTFKAMERRWMREDMYLYSLVLSIIAPCVRLHPDPKSSILWACVFSGVFHTLLLVIMRLLIEFYPAILTPCGNMTIYLDLWNATSAMFAVSIVFSMILTIFSDAEFRQLIGLLGWPFDAPLSCHKMDSYKTAVERNWTDVLKCLIKSDIDRIKGKDASKIETKLQKEGRINWPFKNRRTAVHHACEAQNDQILQLFLDAPADLGHFDAKDASSKTPLHLACDAGLKDTVKMILENGKQNGKHLKEINHTDKGHNTPFMIAIASFKKRKEQDTRKRKEKDQKDIVELFLEASDEKLNHLNHTNEKGYSPFMFAVKCACEKGNEELVRLFIESEQAKRIDFGAKAENDRNIWHILAETNNQRKKKGTKNEDDNQASPTKTIAETKSNIMKLIIQNKDVLAADLHINDRDANQRTPYLVSCTASRDLAFKWFMENAEVLGIDLNAVDKDGLKGYQLACKSNAYEVIKLFLKRGDYDQYASADRSQGKFTIPCGKETITLDVNFDGNGNPTNVEIKKFKVKATR